MTLSGGEPTAHLEFSDKLLRGAHKRLIHTCLDTNGYCGWSIMERLIDNVDIVLFDLKHLNSEKHRELTGASNDIILKNLALLTKAGTEIWVRIPVVPDFNDDIEYHRDVARFLVELPGKIARVDLLPFHNYCQHKYEWLGIDWKYRDVETVESSFLEIHAEVYREKGLVATVGGSGFETNAMAAGDDAR